MYFLATSCPIVRKEVKKVKVINNYLERQIGNGRIMNTMASPSGKRFHVVCTQDHEPYPWRIYGSMFSAVFKTYTDIQDYMLAHNLRPWTAEDERNMVQNSSRNRRFL